MSNSPETVVVIDPQHISKPQTLYKCEIPIGPSPITVRVFLWHKNGLGFSAMIGTIVSTDNGASATLSNIRQQVGAGTDLTSLGICLAKAQLYGSYDSAIPSSIVIGADEQVFTSNSISPNNTLGMVMEFEVTATAACKLRFRSAAWDGPGNVVPNKWSAVPTPANPAHPRGWWPYADITMPCGAFDSNPFAGPPYSQIVCCKENGVEEIAFSPQAVAIDPYGKMNEGLFGVNLFYQWNISNSSAITGDIWAHLLAMHTNFPYYGASDIRAWEDRLDRGVPSLLWSNPDPLNPDGNLNIVDLTQDGKLTIVAGSNSVLRIAAANGGAATMPFLLIVSKTRIEAVPVEPPGDT